MSDPVFRTFREQSLHYFTRPHERAVDHPVECAAAWRGSELPPLDALAYTLNEAELDELDAALAIAKASQSVLNSASRAASERAVRDLTTADFPLPTLSKRISSWRRALADGIGFQVIRGIPVSRWTREESELFFWCLGLHLGTPGGQNAQGDLLGHVVDTGARQADPMVRLYQTSANIAFHCDAADVVGLLCLNKAARGGQSRVASSVTVFNELVTRAPDRVSRLFEPFFLDLRNETARDVGNAISIPPCRYAGGKLRTFYHSDYFRSAQRHGDVPPLSDDERRLLDTYEAIAGEPGIYFDMDLEPGDIQLLSNHTNLHARTEYVDHSDPSAKRHLLRLWLSL